jgi:hypothetical protein
MHTMLGRQLRVCGMERMSPCKSLVRCWMTRVALEKAGMLVVMLCAEATDIVAGNRTEPW